MKTSNSRAGRPRAAQTSPSVSVCKLDSQRVCVGCGRTADEITRWLAMSDDERAAVMQRVKRRAS
ncbi:MAG: DUF1289 domain-containing protein [Pseudomonadota bacterium]